MKKQSQMGTSKYEFNPDQFDIDVEANRVRFVTRRALIHAELKKLIELDGPRIDETFSMMLDVMREFKKHYGL